MLLCLTFDRARNYVRTHSEYEQKDWIILRFIIWKSTVAGLIKITLELHLPSFFTLSDGEKVSLPFCQISLTSILLLAPMTLACHA